ncbi:hypothetical protein CU097_002043, partial [Rhizopus azygosporus]
MYFEDLQRHLQVKADSGVNTDVVMCIKLEGITKGYSLVDRIGIPWAFLYDTIKRYKDNGEDFNCIFGLKNGKYFICAFVEEAVEDFSHFQNNAEEL